MAVAPARTSADDNYKWKAFITVGVALFTMVMDFSITFLALSTIADEFNVTLRAVSWVAIASSLTITAVLLPLGRVADITGRKKFHIAGLLLFALGAVGAALSPSLGLLIAARVVMAVGAAMGQSVVMAIVTAVFPNNERGKALGMITTAVAIGATAGPIVAGPLLQFFGWRSIFVFLAIPTGLSIFFALRILDDARIGSTKQEAGTRYDWTGAVLSALALGLAIVTINNPFRFDWISAPIIGGAAVSAVLFYLFVKWELRVESPMINLRFFSNSTFTWSSITRLLAFVGSSAAFFLVPIYLQSFLGYQQIAAGLVMFIGAFGMGVASQFSGRLSDRFGFRSFTFIGLGMLLVSAVIFALFDESTPAWVIMPVLFFNGLGMGMWMAPNMSATLGAVERQHYGSVSAFVNLVRNIGSVAGQALTSAIVAGVMVARGADVQLSELATSTNPAVKQAFVDGWRYAYVVLAVFIALSIYAAWKTRPNEEKAEDEERVAAPVGSVGQPASRVR